MSNLFVDYMINKDIAFQARIRNEGRDFDEHISEFIRVRYFKIYNGKRFFI